MSKTLWTIVQMVVRNSRIEGFQKCTKNLNGEIKNCSIRGDFTIFRVAIPVENKKSFLNAQKKFL